MKITHYAVLDYNATPIAVRATPEEAATFMAERAKWLLATAICDGARAMSLVAVCEPEPGA
jgi:hypothetical protein